MRSSGLIVSKAGVRPLGLTMRSRDCSGITRAFYLLNLIDLTIVSKSSRSSESLAGAL